MRVILAALILCALAQAGEARTRARQHWGGPDFAISCDTVRAWRAEIGAMSAQAKATLARQFKISRKQRRQAWACLRGSR